MLYSGKMAEMAKIMDQRINDRGKYWRHILKTLIVIEYIAVHGDVKALEYAQSRLGMIGVLKGFSYSRPYCGSWGDICRSKYDYGSISTP